MISLLLAFKHLNYNEKMGDVESNDERMQSFHFFELHKVISYTQ